MGLARKGLRRISVDGDAFVWAVSPDSGYLTVVVEAEHGTGARLEARTVFDGPHGRTRAVTPAGIAALIREARRHGWTPEAGGPPHQMNDIDPVLDAGDAE